MDKDFPENLRDTRTSFRELLRRWTTSSSLSGSLVSSLAEKGSRVLSNKKTPVGVYAGCVGLRKNYGYVGWQWKVV